MWYLHVALCILLKCCLTGVSFTESRYALHSSICGTQRARDCSEVMKLRKVGTRLVSEIKSRQRKPGTARYLCDEVIKQNRGMYLPWKPARVKSKADGRHLEETQAGWIAFRQIKDFAKEYIFHLTERGSPTTHVGFKWWHLVQVSWSCCEERAQRLVTTPVKHSEGCSRAEAVLLEQKAEPSSDDSRWTELIFSFFFF